MKSSSISNSNALILGVREWAAALAVVFAVAGVIYYGWGGWEYYNPGRDHRETCWAERQSDYWAYMRWMKTARERYPVLLIGDSVVWGQEVDHDATISHYLNTYLGGQYVANVGNDGLHMAGIHGIVEHYGDYLGGAKVILQLNPLWISSPARDLRGEEKSRYHHPRLIPQLDSRITYYQDLNTRMGYLSEYVFRIFPFVRHIMVNYFDNKSISTWVMDNPYRNPFGAIDFVATPVMAETQGSSLSWMVKGMRQSGSPFMDPDDSIQFGLFRDAVERLRTVKDADVFVMIGPFNSHYLTPESRDALNRTLDRAKEIFTEMGVPFYDTRDAGIPGETYADSCHLLKSGHDALARGMTADPVFRHWIGLPSRDSAQPAAR